jgi:hypothetical protein
MVRLKASRNGNCISEFSMSIVISPADICNLNILYSSSIDTLTPNKVHFFSNASPALPDLEWYWDFGDGSSSDIEDPVHEYSVTGDYEVCLTVKKNNLCIRSVCDTVSITNIAGRSMITAYPNPVTTNELNVRITTDQPDTYQAYVINQFGAQVLLKTVYLNGGTNYFTLNIATLPRGIYIVYLRGANKTENYKFMRL